MTDNNTQNATQQQNTTPPEGNGTAGKTFTQEEVNTIVRERLARERAKGAANPDDPGPDNVNAEKAALAAERAKLEADRRNFECERYCKESGLDTELVQMIGADEPEAFKKKAEALRSIFARATSGKPVGTYTTFSTGAPHGSAICHESDGTEFFKPSAI